MTGFMSNTVVEVINGRYRCLDRLSCSLGSSQNDQKPGIRADYGKVQFSEWAPKKQKISKYCSSKVKFWGKVVVSELWRKIYEFFNYFFKDGGKYRFLPEIYNCILL